MSGRGDAGAGAGAGASGGGSGSARDTRASGAYVVVGGAGVGY